MKTASGEAASAAAIEVFAPTLLGYAGVGGLHPDDGPSVGPLADGVERDSNDRAGDAPITACAGSS